MSTIEVQHIAITKPDGGIAVMLFVTYSDDAGVVFKREATDDTVNAEIVRTFGLPADQVPSWRRVDLAEFPADRNFRDAWTDAGKIVIDMPKAREIHRGRLRELRAPKLAALDIDYQRADEAGDAKAKARIAKQKKTLRDITDDPAIDAAKTSDDLMAHLASME